MTSSNGGSNKGSNTAFFRPARKGLRKLFDELKRDVLPATFVELVYVHEFAELIWDIMRRRHDKANYRMDRGEVPPRGRKMPPGLINSLSTATNLTVHGRRFR
jgi:hypothetical protein